MAPAAVGLKSGVRVSACRETLGGVAPQGPSPPGFRFAFLPPLAPPVVTRLRGRHKAIPVDPDEPIYAVTVADNSHLKPVQARVVESEEERSRMEGCREREADNNP